MSNDYSSIDVWVGNESAYVNGSLIGDWITLPVPKSELDAFLHERVGVSDLNPDYSVFDVEIDGALEDLDWADVTNATVEDLNLLAGALQIADTNALGERNVSAVAALVDYQGGRHTALEYANALVQADAIDFFEYSDPDYSSNEEKFAATCLNEMGVDNFSQDFLESNFDFHEYGADLARDDCAVGEKGFLELGVSYPELDEYSQRGLIKGFSSIIESAPEQQFPSIDEMTASIQQQFESRFDFTNAAPEIVAGVYEWTNHSSPQDIEAVGLLMDQQGTLPHINELGNAILQVDYIPYCPYARTPQGSLSAEAALGETVVEMYGLPEDVEDYLDLRSMGEELSDGYVLYDNGYLDATAKGPALDAFSREALAQQINNKLGIDMRDEKSMTQTNADRSLASKFEDAKSASQCQDQLHAADEKCIGKTAHIVR